MITDGDVGNTNEVIDFMKKDYEKKVRDIIDLELVQVVKIIEFIDVSTALVSGIAKCGGGESEFVTDGKGMEIFILIERKR